MKLSNTLLGLLATATLASGAASAQQMPPSSMPQSQSQPQSMPQSNGDMTGSTSFKSNDGTTVQVNSHRGHVAPAGPAPDFAQLDANHSGSIDRSEATGYKLLADDFKYADGNRNGSISKTEYTHWVNLP